MNEKTSTGGIVFAGLLLFVLLSAGVAADTTTTSASVTNAAPSVGAITASDPITLSESTTAVVQCNATITDNNGYGDVSAANATFWDVAATTIGAADDYNNHYTNTSCSLSGGSGTTINSVCSFIVHYSANAAEWNCSLTARDGSSATGSNTVANMTVNQLKALASDASLSFGTLALGATSSTDVNITINNTGNAQIDVQLGGYAQTTADNFSMNCSVGGSKIPVGNLKWNLTAAQVYANMSALVNDSAALTVSDFDLAAETTDNTASTKKIHWKLQLPSTDVGGSCTGNVVVTAI